MDLINVVMQLYLKSFISLESDSSVINDLMYSLGISSSLAFTDVWLIDDLIQSMLISCLVFALILVLSISEEYERH